MKKSPRVSTARKPPMPSDSHADIDAWMQNVMPALQPIVKRLDEPIRQTLPGLRQSPS